MGENEQVLFVTHQHWLVLAGEILLESLLSVALIVVVTLMYALWLLNPLVLLGYLLLIFPLISLLRDVLIWSNRKYVVTNRRVMQLAGVFNKNVTDSSLDKVNDVKLTQSFLGRMLGLRRYRNPDRQRVGREHVHAHRQSHPVQDCHDQCQGKTGARSSASSGRTEPHAAPNLADLLTQLDTLRQHGVLTEEEFQAKKADLLKKM